MVALIGPMGVGKSTIGKALAAELGYPFFDTDQLIEERTGADISWIFDVEGEAGFREREHALLKDLLDGETQPSVIATGGGIVMREDNRVLLQTCAVVVYLKADLEQLIARTARDKKRPLLQVDNRELQIRKLMEEREPLYQQVCTATICASKRGPKQVVDDIIDLMNGAS
jgi:shikimate kinase